MNQHVNFDPEVAHEATLPSCPICGAEVPRSTEAKICLFFRVRCRIAPDAVARSYFCDGCEHVFFDPQPTASQLTNYYGAGYQDWYFRQERLAFEPEWADHLAMIADKTSGHWNTRRAVYDAAFPAGASFTGHVVDFGGDDGELARSLFPHAASITVIDAADEPEAADLAQCDLLFAGHVLEHLHSPTAALHALTRHLRPGAQIWAEVPQQYGGPIRAAWENAEESSPLRLMHEHIQHYSPRSVRALMAACDAIVTSQVNIPGAVIGALGVKR